MSIGPGTALVAGGTGAIGKTVSARFLRDGYRVAVTYRSESEWRELTGLEPERTAAGALLGFPTDATDEVSVGRSVESAAAALGSIRVLVHLVGGYAGGIDVERIEPAAVRHMVELNLLSAFWTARHVIPHAKRAGEGRLLFVSSRGAVECYPGAAAYAAAKVGLHALVATLAKELRSSGVTANAILPSVVDTPANRAAMPKSDPSTWIRPEQVASLLSFLASTEASATSGALIPIYGRA